MAPSPVLNLSMLGEVPVIGDLLVSRRGEGVFGMTYSINGHAGEPRVGVNPVSALTPGILRRIFEPVQPREAAGGTGGAHALETDEAPQAEPRLRSKRRRAWKRQRWRRRRRRRTSPRPRKRLRRSSTGT